MRITKKKVLGVGAAAAVVALGAGSAFAFWTTTGTGSGSATVGTDAGFTVTGGVSDTVLLDVEYPFMIHVANDATFPQQLSALTFSVAPGNPGCDPAWFSLTQPTVAAQDIAAGTAVDLAASLKLVDFTSTNQDACKGNGITITYNYS
jgi:hypothetical protein